MSIVPQNQQDEELFNTTTGLVVRFAEIIFMMSCDITV